MKFITALLLVLGLSGLVVGPYAWAATCAYTEANPAQICRATHQLVDSQHPDHELVINGQTVTLTGHGTSTVTITDAGGGVGSHYLSADKGLVLHGTITETTTATGTGTGSATATASGTSTKTGTDAYSNDYWGTWTDTFLVTTTASTTETVSKTLSASYTSRSVGNYTVTLTYTNTITGTGSATGIGTGTGTISGTASATATKQATYSWSSTGTAYWGNTWHNTHTYSATGTITFTATLNDIGGSGGTITKTNTGTACGTGTVTGTGSGTWTNTNTADSIGTSAFLSADPKISNAAKLYAGGTNINFTTGTSSATSSSVDVGDSPVVHVAVPATVTHTHTVTDVYGTTTYSHTHTVTDVGGAVGGSGTKNYLPLWTGTLTGSATATSSSLSNSIFSQSFDGATGYVGQDLHITGNVEAGNISATPQASVIPKADGSGKLDGWVSGRIYSVYGINSGGNVTTDGAGTWITVASTTISPAVTVGLVASATASLTAAYDDTTCYLRISRDSGTAALTLAYIHGTVNYTKFAPFAATIRSWFTWTGSHPVEVQIKDDGVAGHTCTVLQNEGLIVVEIIYE